MDDIVGFICVAVFFVLVVIAIAYWQVILAGGVLAAIGYMAVKAAMDSAETKRKAEEADARRRAEEAAEKIRKEREAIAQLEAHRKAQEQYLVDLLKLRNNSLECFESLPRCLMNAEELLDEAASDFEERAFAPFWETIEEATRRLGSFDDGIESLCENVQQYAEISASYEGAAPDFPIGNHSVEALVTGNATSERLRSIVRKAQRDFEFAQIFEQRKTNQLLVAGFTTLSRAIDGMGQKISFSIGRLGDSLAEMTTSITSSVAALGDHVGDMNRSLSGHLEGLSETMGGVSGSIAAMRATLSEDGKELRSRHDQALDMLDNIQRRRKPVGRSTMTKELSTEPV